MTIPHKTLALSTIALAFGCNAPARATPPEGVAASPAVVTEVGDATSAVPGESLQAHAMSSAPLLRTAAVAPIATDPAVDNVFAYLVQRYDRDGDGAVAMTEYDRTDSQFARWDRDSDGRLTAADFERRSGGAERQRGGAGSTAAPATGTATTGRTRRTLARYFQADEDVFTLPTEEALEAFALYDGSDQSAQDGRISEGEFTCAMQERARVIPGDDSEDVRQAMGDAAPWQHLVDGLDRDRDGLIAEAELKRFFAENLRGRAIDYRETAAERPRRARRPDAQGGSSTAGDSLAAQLNERAPDFTLESPDGTQRATLSSFAGKQPVALIFGSYT